MKLGNVVEIAESLLQAEVQIDQILTDLVQKHWEDKTMKHL